MDLFEEITSYNKRVYDAAANRAPAQVGAEEITVSVLEQYAGICADQRSERLQQDMTDSERDIYTEALKVGYKLCQDITDNMVGGAL